MTMKSVASPLLSTKFQIFALLLTTQLHSKPKTPDLTTLTPTASLFHTQRPGLSKLSVKGQKIFSVLQAIWSLSQLLNLATVGQKQPQVTCKQMNVEFQQNFTNELKFKFHKIFICHKTFDLCLKLLKNVKSILSSRTVKKQVAGWISLVI